MNPMPSLLLCSVLAAVLLVPGPIAAQRASPSGSILIVAHPPVPTPGPEAVRIELVVEGSASSATGARAAGALAVQRVVRALSETGIAVQDLRVAGTTLLAEYEAAGPLRTTTIREAPRPVGYRSVTSITLRTDDLPRIGVLLDTARGAGATPLRAVQKVDRTVDVQR